MLVHVTAESGRIVRTVGRDVPTESIEASWLGVNGPRAHSPWGLARTCSRGNRGPRIALRYLGALRVIFDGDAIHLHRLQRLGVLTFEGGRELAHAPANRAFHFDVGLQVRFDFVPERGKLSVRRSQAAFVVDHGVAKQPIKPSHGGLFRAQRVELVDAAHESILKNVLRGGAAAHTSFQERQELAMVPDERTHHFRGRTALLGIGLRLS
jgi:hypothetical protein